MFLSGQLCCYVVHGPGHCAEVRDCFALKCNGCQHRFDGRTDLDAAGRRHYRDKAQASAVPAPGVPVF